MCQYNMESEGRIIFSRHADDLVYPPGVDELLYLAKMGIKCEMDELGTIPFWGTGYVPAERRDDSVWFCPEPSVTTADEVVIACAHGWASDSHTPDGTATPTAEQQ